MIIQDVYDAVEYIGYKLAAKNQEIKVAPDEFGEWVAFFVAEALSRAKEREARND